ncbi:hypothetical protein CXG81DRAFT_29198 [Caulochytrium protostelioides]|uniref:Uncharacterized protein n=1 Tax=Caulochytrium protostelioides TaxID=1555241 RepID=A0A4P9XDX3_9FUNG|nr:hypothetical protein CXG81DRAFT_29198 [Caulochytrium protostelioides]|eukprot:RKP03715.1 hypothetical protein CXG81DRAFT_29198 [Caulochytrium protostelioides]
MLTSQRVYLERRLRDEYRRLLELPAGIAAEVARQQSAGAAAAAATAAAAGKPRRAPTAAPEASVVALIRIAPQRRVPKPQWHAPWKLMRVMSGHLGWARCLAVEPNNEWFVTGAADRTIKVWDMASGKLKVTLTGHIAPVRGLAVSSRHPYLFSCSEDRKVKCWDLETNKIIRDYHGHLHGVFSLDLHPTLDVVVTAGRDATVRVWDMRTKAQIHCLTGHKGVVTSVKCQSADPQILSAGQDATVKLWDLAAGKCRTTLTHHTKGIRALALHPSEFTFASASPGTVKQWQCPEGRFLQSMDVPPTALGSSGIVNTLSVNDDGVLFGGDDDGAMSFWDWKTGHAFQRTATVPQPGSLAGAAENGIFASTFDQTGLRLITAEADKTIKMWREDPNASPETHPLDWKPLLRSQRY